MSCSRFKMDLNPQNSIILGSIMMLKTLTLIINLQIKQIFSERLVSFDKHLAVLDFGVHQACHNLINLFLVTKLKVLF